LPPKREPNLILLVAATGAKHGKRVARHCFAVLCTSGRIEKYQIIKVRAATIRSMGRLPGLLRTFSNNVLVQKHYLNILNIMSKQNK
jgi:hypothetical protein